MGDEVCVGYHNNNNNNNNSDRSNNNNIDAMTADDQILSIHLRLGEVRH